MGEYEEIDLLIKTGKNLEALELLRDIKKTKTLPIDETGWMYWNISDIPAVLRKPRDVYENHIEFVEWGKQALFPHKLHWFVSDATQALTLSLGDYFDEWFKWYLFSCKYSSRNKENRAIRFESHRAAAISLLVLKRFFEIEIPITNMAELLEEDKDWENTLFAEFTYYTLLAEKAFLLDQSEHLKEALKNINRLTDLAKEVIYTKADKRESGMLGSWEGLNCSRLTKESMSVLLHNGACMLHKIRKYKESAAMFQLALQNGSNFTAYSLSLFLSSLWKENKNNLEVVEAFTNYSPEGICVNELFQFASDLKEVDWQLSRKED
ncbi:hypothetical protein [Sporosarcina koreensis]|uniref:hypothetical protein n=1 Tax=Bacillales TaxID=1385 RepID=UPI00075200EC|nr:hypothetical protein [Sporosarcina koreensis]